MKKVLIVDVKLVLDVDSEGAAVDAVGALLRDQQRGWAGKESENSVLIDYAVSDIAVTSEVDLENYEEGEAFFMISEGWTALEREFRHLAPPDPHTRYDVQLGGKEMNDDGFDHPTLNHAQTDLLVQLVETEMESQANFAESGLLVGDRPYGGGKDTGIEFAAKAAQKRVMLREIRAELVRGTKK